MTAAVQEKWCLVGLSLLRTLDGCLTGLLTRTGNPQAMFEASAAELQSNWGLDEPTARQVVRERAEVDLDAERRKVRDAGARIVTIFERDYPRLLARVSSPPPILYVMGDACWEGPCVAIVGARKASAYGLASADKLSRELVGASVTVVSGLALGIDGAAHKAAIDAGGRTVAVLGCGIDICYPKRHAALMSEVARSGCLISEFPIGTPPLPQHFPRRNRIISGMSLATVVVEARLNSGSLYTADFALAQGREVLAVPGSIYSETSDGTNALLSDGAAPARSAEDIFDAVGLEAPERTQSRAQRLSAREVALVEALSGGSLRIDELADRSRQTTDEVSALLTILEVRGAVRKGLDQRYVLVR